MKHLALGTALVAALATPAMAEDITVGFAIAKSGWMEAYDTPPRPHGRNTTQPTIKTQPHRLHPPPPQRRKNPARRIPPPGAPSGTTRPGGGTPPPPPPARGFFSAPVAA